MQNSERDQNEDGGLDGWALCRRRSTAVLLANGRSRAPCASRPFRIPMAGLSGDARLPDGSAPVGPVAQQFA
jgi:hypothetical protein